MHGPKSFLIVIKNECSEYIRESITPIELIALLKSKGFIEYHVSNDCKLISFTHTDSVASMSDSWYMFNLNNKLYRYNNKLFYSV